MMPVFRHMGSKNYEEVHQEMQRFTDLRDKQTKDEIWFVEHMPVFTLGRNKDKENVLIESTIPFVKSDRGGDVTYHGPGQLIVYCLIDLKRAKLGVKSLVSGLEDIIIQYLYGYEIVGHRIESAPGVYVNGDKIASLGLRVRNGCSFHGMSINVDMDLEPFTYIHPCGLEGMKVTQLTSLGLEKTCSDVATELSEAIIKKFYS